MVTSAFCVCIGLGLGNFTYQAMTSHQWGEAAERTFFQIVAVVAFVIARALVSDGRDR